MASLTITDIRMFLADNPATNMLIDDYEWTEDEINSAIRLTVDKWNETNPPVGVFTVDDVVADVDDEFPYRYHFLIGACSMLLRIAANKYRRNRLKYNIGGGSIDDQDKEIEYTKAAGALTDEFNSWMIREKVRLNINAGWGFDWPF